MSENSFDKEKIVSHWIESSEKDFKTMDDLFSSQNYHWSLFIGHLVIEKLLKALYVKTLNSYPPMIHDLRRIYEKSNLEIDNEYILKLDTITRFNINARYDDYKLSFYNLCTKEFTEKWISEIKDCRLWILSKL